VFKDYSYYTMLCETLCHWFESRLNNAINPGNRAGPPRRDHFNNTNGDISVIRKKARIKRRFLALLHPKLVIRIHMCIDIVVLDQNI
jgi:hypothetical protein